MSVNSMIITALASICPAAPTLTELTTAMNGKLPDEYATFTVNTFPRAFGDNVAGLEGYSVTVHYFCPLGVNPLNKKKLIKQALQAAGFVWPRVEDVTAATGADSRQHFAFITAYTDGGDCDG